MTQPERESMEVDILFVGAGPATLASAYHLMKQVEAHNESCSQTGRAPIDPPAILVIEKAPEVGGHQLSGAMMDPKAIAELMPDFMEQGFPTTTSARTTIRALDAQEPLVQVPVTPPPFVNHGNYAISLSDVVKWLAAKCEERGIEIYPGFAAARSYDGNRVVGVHRRPGHRQGRQAQERVRAGHRDPRQVRGVRRGPARLAARSS